MPRTDEYKADFAHVLEPLDDETKFLVLDGSIEICSACGGLSAYAWQDCTGYEEFPDGIIPGGFTPDKGKVAHVGAASGFEFQCGHCRRNIMSVDSPLNSPLFTHREDETDDD
jgi:hypothetical protein